MRRGRLDPNVVSYNAAVSACEKGQQWEMALSLMGQMRRSRVDPDEISNNVAVSAVASGGSAAMVDGSLSSDLAVLLLDVL